MAICEVKTLTYGDVQMDHYLYLHWLQEVVPVHEVEASLVVQNELVIFVEKFHHSSAMLLSQRKGHVVLYFLVD